MTGRQLEWNKDISIRRTFWAVPKHVPWDGVKLTLYDD